MMRTTTWALVLSALVGMFSCAVSVCAAPIGGSLVMHYDAANVVVTGVNDVTSWTNQGTLGAVLNAPTTTAPNYPSLIASGPNAQPVVRFNGNSKLQTNALGSDLAQPSTVLSIAFMNAFATDPSPVIFDGRIMTKRNGFYFSPTGNPIMFGPTERAPITTPTFSGYNLWTTYFNHTTSALNLNGGNVAIAAGGTGTNVLDGLTIGGRFAPQWRRRLFLEWRHRGNPGLQPAAQHGRDQHSLQPLFCEVRAASRQ